VGGAPSDAAQQAWRTTARREIGPLGTATRVVGGLLFVAIPIAVHGIGWWDAAATLVGLPLLAGAVAAGLEAVWRRYRPGSPGASAAMGMQPPTSRSPS
jgi:hypothetical protein